jgi:ribosomal protein S6--L-glutamate ligase
MAKNNVTVIVLTSSKNDLSDTVNKIGMSCKKFGVKFYPILTQYAYIDDRATTRESITIHNYDGKGKSVTLDPRDVVCFTRGGVANTQIGLAILTIFENTGMFVINERKAMELCANKLYSAIQLDSYRIPTPRTAFVANLSSLDDALDKIGNKFPVIVKTLTGAEGVGVSIVESYESLKSVLQTLWKYDAELLIQEYLEIKNDVRVLVLDGKVVAAAMRGKAPKDFRTNLAQGAEGGPYKLNDTERKIAEHAASAFGCYYVGVDMVTSGGKSYVIELNSSPGSGNVYRSYFEGSEGDDITGQRLIDNVIKHSIDRTNWHFNHREAGLIEPLKIDGIGDFQAKLDTGNESYNVLGAENVEEYNGTVSFRVQGKQYEMPVVSHVRIRTNNINVDRRPVVELDVEFRNRTFRKVRFSLVPRKLNKYPVLIGNRFMQLAKVSVNVNTVNMLPEHNIGNHYIHKIHSLNSLVEIAEMHEILEEKLRNCTNQDDRMLIEEAIGTINVAKYNLKNKQQTTYDRNAIMHADRKFLEFLEQAKNRTDDDSLHSLMEAKGKKKSKSKKRKKRSKSIFDRKYLVRGKKKLTAKQYEKWGNAIARRKAKAERKAGITRRKGKDQGHKGYHFAFAASPEKELAAVRFWNYRLANPRYRGNPIQTGYYADRKDGDLKGRFYRYYGKNGQRSRTGAKADAIRYAVAKRIASGQGPSKGQLAGLAKGRSLRWRKGGK